MGSYDSSKDFKDVPSYEVGYKKPPKAHQYKKGQSGYPQGRKPEPRTLKGSFASVLSEKISIKDNGKDKKVTLRYALAKKMIGEALNGNFRTMEFIFKFLGDIELPRDEFKMPIETPEQREVRNNRKNKIFKYLEMLDEQDAEGLLQNTRKVENDED